jgi:hypothetical protein
VLYVRHCLETITTLLQKVYQKPHFYKKCIKNHTFTKSVSKTTLFIFLQTIKVELFGTTFYTFSHFKRPFLYNNETYIKTKLKIYIFIHDLFWL